ncbi:MAG: hypothetical protein HKN24_11395 [Acidimicrobiales bacterium]|nr:hypothetical protein [Acidimicrobiales bacterium]
MKNQKILTVATLAGLTIGGLSVSAAAAQSYGDDSSAPTVETVDPTVETDLGDIVLVQEAEDPGTPESDSDGEHEDRRGHRGGCDLEEAAIAIGIDEADLRAAIASGDTIADVAAANGVDVDVVIDAMVDAKAERISEKVTDGRITEAEADEKLAELEARITDRVNGVEDDAQA